MSGGQKGPNVIFGTTKHIAPPQLWDGFCASSQTGHGFPLQRWVELEAKPVPPPAPQRDTLTPPPELGGAGGEVPGAGVASPHAPLPGSSAQCVWSARSPVRLKATFSKILSDSIWSIITYVSHIPYL